MAQDLGVIAVAAAEEAGGLDPALLGSYLDQLAAAADRGRRLDETELADARAAGARAADEGVPLGALVDLFLSATWRAWRVLPAVSDANTRPTVLAVGEAVLRAADDAVAAAAEGYQAARRWVIRREEALRREFVDDLLAGTADTGSLLGRAEQFGLDLAATHTVLVAVAPTPFRDATPVVAAVEDAAARAAAGGAVLVTTKDGQLVCIAPTGVAAVEDRAGRAVSEALSAALSGPEVETSAVSGPAVHWRCGVGRGYRGPAGIRQSYGEARDSITLADRLGLDTPVVRARDLLIYWVLLRDRAAIADLVETVLAPLRRARGGADTLLETLTAFFAHGGNATAAARDLGVSVRAVTYRLARIHELTGHDPADAHDRYVLQTAVIGAPLTIGFPGMPSVE